MKKVKQGNPLFKYYTERWAVFTLHLNNTIAHFGEEDLHQLRVEIKKMRALFSLLEGAIPGGFKKKKYEKPLQKLFRPGGKLRETHMNKVLVEAYNLKDPDNYNQFQETLADKHTEKLKRRLETIGGPELDQLFQQITGIINNIGFDAVYQSAFKFLNIEFNAIEHLYPDIENEKTLHKVRMHLKSSGYILKFVVELHPHPARKIFYDEVKTTESLIGDWHDKVVFKQSLRAYTNLHSNAWLEADLDIIFKKIAIDLKAAQINISQHLSAIIKSGTIVFRS